MAPGDNRYVVVPDLAKPINCYSAERAALVVEAVNALLEKQP